MSGHLPPLALLWREPWRPLIAGPSAAFAAAFLTRRLLAGGGAGGGRLLRPLLFAAGGAGGVFTVVGWHAPSLVLLPVILAPLSLIPSPPFPQSGPGAAGRALPLVLLLAAAVAWLEAGPFAGGGASFVALMAHGALGLLVLSPFLLAGPDCLSPPRWAVLGPAGALLLAAFLPAGQDFRTPAALLLSLGGLALALGHAAPPPGRGRGARRRGRATAPLFTESALLAALFALSAAEGGGRPFLREAPRLALFALSVGLFLRLARRWGAAAGGRLRAALAFTGAAAVSGFAAFSAAALLGWR